MSEQSSQCTITRGDQMTTVDSKAFNKDGDTFLYLIFRKKEHSQAQIIQIIEGLLDDKVDINVFNINRKTVLHMAIDCGYKDVIDFFIQRNADLNVMDSDGNTLAHYVVEQESRKFRLKFVNIIYYNPNLLELENQGSNFVDWMLSRGFDFFHRRNKKNQSALYLAIELKLHHIIFTLLKHVTDFPSIQKDQTPFFRAYLSKINNIYNNRYFYTIMKIILENNNFINENTLKMTLPLVINMNGRFDEINLILQYISSVDCISGTKSMIQVFTNKCHFWRIDHVVTILQALVRKGADINEHVAYGKTIAFMWLNYHPKIEMLLCLQGCGADFTVRTNNGKTFLHLISRHSNEPGTIDFLTKKGCDVNDIDGYGNSPLSLACENGHAEVVEVLIKYGANLKYKNKFGRNLLHLAVESQSTVELLVKNGMNTNSKDNLGETPLHLADSNIVVKTLYSRGADIDPQDNNGDTPLYNGMVRSDLSIVEELLKCGADIRERKTFQTAMSLFQDPFALNFNATSRYVMEHLVKMSALGLLNKISHTDEWCDQEVQQFFKKCQKELKLLKGFFVNGSTSLYELLRKNPNRRRRRVHMDNEKLKNLVDNVAIEQEFPNYFVLIMGYYNSTNRRQSLLNKAIDVFNQAIQFSLPDLCIDEIFMYLNNVDLMCFIEAI